MYWQTIMDDNPDCRYLFLGDYLDPYQPIPQKELIQNLHRIILMKQELPNDIILLLGNHDLHYFASDMPYSSRFDPSIARPVAKLFLENMHLFQYAFQEEDRIFTHAGISHRWFTEDFMGNLNENIAAQLNHPKDEQIPAICRSGEARGGLPGTIGGIFWADRSELKEPLPGFRQFAGHNRVPDILVHESNGGQITFCDCLRYEKYLKLE
jgi:hypothetical protein